MYLHHITFSSHSHQVARREGGELQGERGVVPVVLLAVEEQPFVHWRQMAAFVIGQSTILISQFVTDQPLLSITIVEDEYISVALGVPLPIVISKISKVSIPLPI